MERQTDKQYDDDLTVGIGDYDDESIDTGYVDLFEFTGDETSPIARLKTIVLSIDWEITDEVLIQFNDELLDLRNIWAGDSIKLIYVQALQKISKYIFQRKSESHPSAIKLLLTFYYNLEKIVLDANLSENDKKKLLRADVKKFEQLKRLIEAETSANKKWSDSATGVSEPPSSAQGTAQPVLFNLKACILGMDWEISERELSELSREIRHLEKEFAGNKPRMLFLQGIEALGGYIKLKRSNVHADAFKMLSSFYEGLEKIVVNDLTLEEEKAILFPEIEKFEQFKKIIAPTLDHAETPDDESEKPSAAHDYADESVIAPAFADITDEVHGFQAEDEAAQFGDGLPADVEGRLNQFFSESTATLEADDGEMETGVGPVDSFTQEAADQVASFFDSEESRPVSSYPPVSEEEALRGVDVETDADDDLHEVALPTEPNGKLAPALADTDGQQPELSNGERDDVMAGLATESTEEVEEIEEKPAEETARHTEAALVGVDVETEADDEQGEMALPLTEDNDLAPALSMDDVDLEGGWPDNGETGDTDIEERLDALFAEHDSVIPPALEGVELDIDREPAEEEDRSATMDEAAAALFDPEESMAFEERLDSLFGEDEGDAAGKPAEAVDDDAEVEEPVATFFEDSDDQIRLPSDLPPGAEKIGSASDDQGDAGVRAGAENDEIVFTAVEEDDHLPVAQELAEAIIEDEQSERVETGDFEDEQSKRVETDDTYPTFASESEETDFFATIDERVDEPGEFQMELLDETEDIDTRTVALLDATDDAAPAASGGMADADFGDGEDEEEAYVFFRDDDLADLRAGIASLGVEISDNIVQGILSAVNGLRHRFANRPMEKTFLQLISTIIQHIGQYRYEASAEAHGLVLSVFDKLELVQSPETRTDQAQEILLTETTKVLLWQQTMLDRQAIRKGEELTFMAPVRSDPAATDDTEAFDGERVADAIDGPPEEPTEQEKTDDFSAVFEPVEEEIDRPVPLAGFEEEGDSRFLTLGDEPDIVSIEDDLQAMVDVDDAEYGIDEPAGESDSRTAADGLDPITEFVKKELEALRISLQAEIEELRRRLED